MRTFLYLFGILLIMTGTAAAQSSIGLNVFAGGGLTVPLQDMKDSWKIGGHGDVGFGFSLTPGLDAGGRYHFFALPLDDSPDSVSFVDTDDDLTVHEFSGEIRALLSPPGINIRPYGIIGIGFAKFPDRTEFFYCVGGGLKYGIIPRLDFFIEGRYNWVSIEDYSVSYIPLSIGVSLSL